MTVPLITEAALFDGGLLERYLRVRGSLLPADELKLATQWLGSRRTANEVVSGDADALFGWLRDAARPPRLANTEGHELVVLEQRWRLSTAGWNRLAAVLEPEGDDELNEMYEDDAGMRWLRARLLRKGDDVIVETNSRERADRWAQRLRDADPGAELLSETESDPAGLRAVPDPVELTPELQEALQQMIRQHEQRWVDESIPMFGGRTPREMVRSAAGRQQVEDFLADVEAEQPPAGSLPGAGMDPGRIRALLGLPAVLR